jgi:hypothetical protein
MKRLLVPIAVVVASVVALAACGSSNNNSTVPSLSGGHGQQGASSGSLAAARAAVACARRHGMPSTPDPTLDANGQVTFAGGEPTPTPEVRSACAAQIRAAQAASSTLPNLSSSDIRALVRWAACMRAHGFPHWPDPNAQGEFYVNGHDGTLVQNQRADAACRSLPGSSLARVTAGPYGQ